MTTNGRDRLANGALRAIAIVDIFTLIPWAADGPFAGKWRGEVKVTTPPPTATPGTNSPGGAGGGGGAGRFGGPKKTRSPETSFLARAARLWTSRTVKSKGTS